MLQLPLQPLLLPSLLHPAPPPLPKTIAIARCLHLMENVSLPAASNVLLKFPLKQPPLPALKPFASLPLSLSLYIFLPPSHAFLVASYAR